jgi:hypothetical protein
LLTSIRNSDEKTTIQERDFMGLNSRPGSDGLYRFSVKLTPHTAALLVEECERRRLATAAHVNYGTVVNDALEKLLGESQTAPVTQSKRLLVRNVRKRLARTA